MGPSVKRFSPLILRRFFHRRADNTPEAKTVFCSPILTAQRVTVEADTSNGSIYNVTEGPFDIPENDVINGANGRRMYNGSVKFASCVCRDIDVILPQRGISCEPESVHPSTRCISKCNGPRCHLPRYGTLCRRHGRRLRLSKPHIGCYENNLREGRCL